MRVIAKKLDMKTRDLLRLNPDVGRKPEVNTLIIIPSKQLKNRAVNKDEILVSNTLNPTDKELKTTLIAEKEKQKELLILELEKEFKLHKVKKGDTFYGLTRFYNVTQEDLIALNPKLIEGLKLSQVIKIMPLEASVREENFLYRDEIEKGVALKIAILLPFRAIELDTLSGEEIENLINKNIYPADKQDLKVDDEKGSALSAMGLKPKIVH